MPRSASKKPDHIACCERRKIMYNSDYRSLVMSRSELRIKMQDRGLCCNHTACTTCKTTILERTFSRVNVRVALFMVRMVRLHLLEVHNLQKNGHLPRDLSETAETENQLAYEICEHWNKRMGNNQRPPAAVRHVVQMHPLSRQYGLYYICVCKSCCQLEDRLRAINCRISGDRYSSDEE